MLSTSKIGNIPGCEKYRDYLRYRRELTRGVHTPEMRRKGAMKNRGFMTSVLIGWRIVRVKGVFIQSAAPNPQYHINPYEMALN